MTDLRCPIDHRSLVGDAKVCERCSRETRRQLAEIPKLYVEAGAYLVPGKGGFGSSGSERTIGVNLSALGFRAADEILPVLEEWERTVRVLSLGQVELDGQDREGEVELNPDGTVKVIVRPRLNEGERPIIRTGTIQERVEGSCSFLLVHSRWLSAYEGAPDWVADIAKIHGQGGAATRQNQAPARRIECPADLGDGLCLSLLTLPEDGDKQAKIKCHRCRTEWTIQWLIEVALSTKESEYWLDAESIANHLQMDHREVRRLARKWKITKHGQLYDLSAFIDKRSESKRDTPSLVNGA